MVLDKNLRPKKTYKDYMDVINVVCKVEYKRLNNSYMVEFDELQNIAIITVHTILQENPTKEFNITYLSVAIKWAIRNELRRRYNWYSAKADDENEMKELHTQADNDYERTRIPILDQIENLKIKRKSLVKEMKIANKNAQHRKRTCGFFFAWTTGQKRLSSDYA